MMRSVCAAGNLIAAVQEEGGDIRQLLAPVFSNNRQDPDDSFESFCRPSVAKLFWETPSGELDCRLQRFLNTTTTSMVARCHSYTSHSICYATHRHSRRDSHIYFDYQGYGRFGRIADIIAYRHKGLLECVAVVAPFIPLKGETEKQDPYRGWGDVAGKLLYAEPDDPLLLSFDVVRGHAMFRECELGALQLVHMMALDKVVLALLPWREC